MTTENEEGTQAVQPSKLMVPIGPNLPKIDVFVLELDPPEMTTRCFRCKCPFGAHYLSFNDEMSGCATKKTGTRGADLGRCDCEGYTHMPKQPWVR